LKTPLPSRPNIAALVAACISLVAPVPAQQNHGSAAADRSKTPPSHVEKFNVKQEFGPQTAARRGDRMGVATPPSQGAGNNSSGASQSTEKYKQEFGPQQASRRGDRMSMVSPPPNSNPQNAALASSSARQSQAATRHKRKQPEGSNPSAAIQFNPIATGGTQKSAGSSPQSQAGPKSNLNSPR